MVAVYGLNVLCDEINTEHLLGEETYRHVTSYNQHRAQSKLSRTTCESMNFSTFSLSTLICILVVCFTSLVGQARGDEISTEIRRISFASRSDGAGIVIRLHAKAPVHAFSEPRVTDSNRIELVIFNASLTSSYKFDSPYDPITNVSVETNNGHLSFSFLLDDGVTVETAAYPDQTSDDILIGITTLKDDRPAEPSLADRGEALPDVKQKPAPLKTVPVENTASSEPILPSTAESTTAAASNHHETPVIAVSHSMPSGDQWVLDTVVIDAGHGGHDSGAVANGVKEKDVNLNVALKLGYYLERFLKLKVVYTRTDDSFVDLEERGHIANEAGAKLFISIHANSAPYSRTVRGTETYILGLHKSEKARDVMERENSVVALEDDPNKYDAFYQNSIIRTLALSANLKLSEKLAGYIENQFEERARRNSRGVKQAGLIVLWAASMPAVLVELGYLTNRFEAAYLTSEQGQDYLASAIYRAVRDFKEEYEKGLELSASNQ